MAKNYTLKPVRTPIAPPSSEQAAGDGASPQRAHADATKLHVDDCIRPESEDDDGYDPYSDRIEPTPLFERDPWE